MRLAVIRQRYTPFGGAERFLENALQALIERNVTVTLYTREWRAPSPHGACVSAKRTPKRQATRRSSCAR